MCHEIVEFIDLGLFGLRISENCHHLGTARCSEPPVEARITAGHDCEPNPWTAEQTARVNSTDYPIALSDPDPKLLSFVSKLL